MSELRFRVWRLSLVSVAVLAMAGCASVNFDSAVDDANAATTAFTQGKLAISRTAQDDLARRKLSSELLAQPLTQEGAVQLALANSPAVQALLAQSWSELSAANQTARIANPVFTFERLRTGNELELGRLLSFGLLDLLTLPQRYRVAQSQSEAARLQLSASVVEHVTQIRQAWVRAVATWQSHEYARQINQAAQASAELARRMQQVGNFNKLQRARQQSFYADSAAQLAASQHAATAAREELVRLLGLTDVQAAQLVLPDRLPDLPQESLQVQAINTAAAQQRLDVQIARKQLDFAGRSQGLELLGSVIDVELGVRRDTVIDSSNGSSTPGRGFELGIRLPLFDWGAAQRDRMNAQSLVAAHRYESTVRSASSQLRESYSAYRTAYDVARHYRDEIVPLRKTMADENLLRYNGMLIGVFELLADTREQISSVKSAIDAYQQFWLADASLAASLIGKPVGAAANALPLSGRSSSAEAAH